jgi:hypothetical protein
MAVGGFSLCLIMLKSRRLAPTPSEPIPSLFPTSQVRHVRLGFDATFRLCAACLHAGPSTCDIAIFRSSELPELAEKTVAPGLVSR